LHDSQQQTVLAEAYQEIENVRAGWQWALAQGDTALLAAYLETFASLYLARSQFSEGQALFSQAVTALADMPDEPVLTARLLTWQARFDMLLGHYDSGRKLPATGGGQRTAVGVNPACWGGRWPAAWANFTCAGGSWRRALTTCKKACPSWKRHKIGPARQRRCCI
jgi:hypothetical protein